MTATVQRLRPATTVTSPLDLAKRDMTLVYGDRTFAVRAFPNGDAAEGAGWRAVIIENRTPLRHHQAPDASLADCFAGAVRFLTALVETRPAAVPDRG